MPIKRSWKRERKKVVFPDFLFIVLQLSTKVSLLCFENGYTMSTVFGRTVARKDGASVWPSIVLRLLGVFVMIGILQEQSGKHSHSANQNEVCFLQSISSATACLTKGNR